MPEQSNAMGGALNAAWKVIPRAFVKLSHPQGRNSPISKKNTIVEEVVPLALTSRTPDAIGLHKQVARLCGERVANATWGIRLYFGDAQIAFTLGLVFVTHTQEGWKAWYTRSYISRN
jgi:hypothetical protein